MAVRSVPKLGTELLEFIETICANSGCEGAVTGCFWVAKLCNYEMNCIVVCFGPRMAVDCGFTK